MAWWNKVKSAAKSAVNKAKDAVKKVADAVKETISKTISKVKSSVSRVKRTIKKTVSKSVKKASSSVKRITSSVRKTISKTIKKAGEKVADAVDYIKRDTEKKIERAQREIYRAEELGEPEDVKKAEAELRELQKAEPTWTEKLMDKVRRAFKIKLPLLGVPSFPVLGYVYEKVTGKKLTIDESVRLGKRAVAWALSLNTYSKLFTGKNLDGKPEEFGTEEDFINIGVDILTVGLIFLTPGLPDEAAVKLGSKGFIKLFDKKTDAAIKLFQKLGVKKQTTMIRGLLKTDDGIRVLNRLLKAMALKKVLVRPTIGLIARKTRDKILYGSGLGAVVRKGFKLKTIAMGLGGIIGTIGLAYGIPFGTEWMAKEGLDEILRFPLRDRIKEYRFDPTPEKLEAIKRNIAQLETSVPIAERQIKSVAWLWPFTKEAWYQYIENLNFELEEMRVEVEALKIIEEMPEKIKTTVRDIIDGDTIDVSLEAENAETDEKIILPEYARTGHARIRVVGINSPEKSPKGEILCTDIEIFEVEKKYTDESRERLLPLNDKTVILKTDPDNLMDGHGRILAVVEYVGKDIGLRQIQEGLACYYFREEHKWVDDNVYEEETLKAKEEGEGMWKGLEEVEKEEEKIKIYITSTPSNAKLYLDDVMLHHNTPSDEKELSDVIHLFTLGTHTLSAEKAGRSAMEEIKIVKGDNGEIHLTLETAPLEEEVPPEEVPPEEVPPEEVPPEEVPEGEIPEVYSGGQLWALLEAFSQIWELTKGREVMKEEERETLIESFTLYTDEQKKVLDLLWEDLKYYTKGIKQLSTNEFNELKTKYHVEEL